MALKLKLDEDDFVRDATVFGLCSDLPDHRLCFFLNIHLSLNLRRNARDHRLVTRQQDYYYPEYFCCDNQGRDWHLSANRNGWLYYKDEDRYQRTSTSFVSDLKIFDYFLWYEEVGNISLEEELAEKLKSLSYVRTSKLIDQSNSTHIKNLLIE